MRLSAVVVAIVLAACDEPAKPVPFAQALQATAVNQRLSVTGHLAVPERGATVRGGRVTLRFHADSRFSEPSMLVELPSGTGADTVDAPPATYLLAGVKGRRHDGSAFSSADPVRLVGTMRVLTLDSGQKVPSLADVRRIEAP